MKKIYVYPGRIASSSHHSWDNEWAKYTVERTLLWNKYSEMIFILEKYLPKVGRIIEAGCGLGRIVVHFRNKGYNIIGVDWSKEAIKKIKKYDSSIVIEYGDLRRLKYPNESFSAYISEGVIEHFEEGPMEILKEAHRVLIPKRGLLIVSIPIYNTFLRFTLPFKESDIFRLLFKRTLLGKVDSREFDHYLFTLKEFKGFIERAGFKIVEVKPLLHAAGLYRCFPFFRNRAVSDEFDIWGHTDRCLNTLGKYFLNMSKNIIPWAYPTSACCVAKKI